MKKTSEVQLSLVLVVNHENQLGVELVSLFIVFDAVALALDLRGEASKENLLACQFVPKMVLQPGHNEGWFLVEVNQIFVLELRQLLSADLQLPVAPGERVLFGQFLVFLVVVGPGAAALFFFHG